MPQGTITGSVPLTKSQLGKARQIKLGHRGPRVEACICSICAQRSNAVPGSRHAYCDGIALRQMGLKSHLKGPEQGEWVTVANYDLAMVEFDKLRKVIALITWISSWAIPPKEKIQQLAQARGVVVEIGKLGDRTKQHHPRRDVRKAA